jgi:hypothetical protein
MDVGRRRSVSVSKKRSPVLKKLERIREAREQENNNHKTEETIWSRMKQKLSCCFKSKNASQKHQMKDFKLNSPFKAAALPPKVQKKRSEGDKIPPKRIGDKRKTLVIEVMNLIIYFMTVPKRLKFLENQSVSQIFYPQEINSKLTSVMKQPSTEVKTLVRSSFEEFLSEIQTYYEVILWSTSSRQVRHRY